MLKKLFEVYGKVMDVTLKKSTIDKVYYIYLIDDE